MSPTQVQLTDATLRGAQVQESQKCLGDLPGIFRDLKAWQAMDPKTLVYHVQSHFPAPAGQAGELFFGVSILEAGQVGGEFFMTRGHRHTDTTRAEYYWHLAGEGLLLLMDSQRQCRAEKVTAGSVHHISGDLAHRLVNIGSGPLHVGACWPADAGYDYQCIEQGGFSLRVMQIDGQVRLVAN